MFTSGLKKQVDLPVWEWCRFAPAVSAATTCSCVADTGAVNVLHNRYIYYHISSAAFFWRYDTVTDSWQQLASPITAVATGASMRFSGSHGYFGRVISSTNTTIVTGLPFGGTAYGYKIRIISGTGQGQERMITAVSDPVAADFGVSTAGVALSTTVATLTDSNKTWGSYNSGSVWSVNTWVGYNLRMTTGGGVFQSRKILYNNSTVLTISDTNCSASDPWAHVQWAAPGAGSQYVIESSTITVDTAWSTNPDTTSRYVIQSGGIYLLSSAAAAPFYTLQYYDVLADVWYVKPALTNMVAAAGSDFTLEMLPDEATIWVHDIASNGSGSTLTTTNYSWPSDQWKNYYLFIYSGTGKGQWTKITGNSTSGGVTTINGTFSPSSPDNTSRYQIMGYDLGTATASAAAVAWNSIADATKSWTTNQYTNFAVRILYGTGMGQTRTISSNTGTVLTIYGNWNIAPDTSSIYCIQGDSNTMYFMLGGYSEVFIHRTGDIDMLSHGRVLDSGIACALACYVSNSAHTIFEQAPIALSGLANAAAVATATSVYPHCLQVGQYVSIHGATGADANYYDGVYAITNVPTTTTFTYGMTGTPSGSNTGLPAQTTSILYDATKDYRQLTNGGGSGTTTITFAAATPSNINGWWISLGASGAGVGNGVQVYSGAGTTSLTVSTNNTGTVSGQLIFTPWMPTFTIAFQSGGAQYVNTVTLGSASPANCTGWYVSGTNIAARTYIVSGAGNTAITLSNPNTGQISGNVTFGNNLQMNMVYASTIVPTALTGNTTGTAQQILTNTSNSLTMAIAMTAPVAGVTRYVIAKRDMVGAIWGGGASHQYYNSGISTGGASTTLPDTTAQWKSTGLSISSGTQYTTALTFNNPTPSYINGWYVTGTGVQTGTKVSSGAGGAALTLSVALGTGGAVGTITFDAFSINELVTKRIKVLAGTGIGVDSNITSYTQSSQTITFAAGTPAVNSPYAIMAAPARAASTDLFWAFGTTDLTTRGRYLFSPRGGVVGIDRLDITTDSWMAVQYSPMAEALVSSSMYAYDKQNRLYFCVGITNRIYYLDLTTNLVYGAGVYPYAAGTAIIGNRMEIFTTADGLRYLWLNRHSNQECFKQLLFY